MTIEKQIMPFSRQYLITNDSNISRKDWVKTTSKDGQIGIYTHPMLNISFYQEDDRELFLLGYILNPYLPQQTNEEILKELASYKTFDELLWATYPYSGRYMLLYKSKTEFKVFHDALGQQEIYYHFKEDKFYLVKQPIFLNQFLSLTKNQDKSYWDFVQSEKFKKLENAFFGEETAYQDVFHLLPNFFLDLIKKKKKRYFPNIPLKKKTLQETLDEVVPILKGAIEAVSHRSNLYIGFTGGGDSRVCVAASKHQLSNIKTLFVNQYQNMTEKDADIWIPKELSVRLNLPFQINPICYSLQDIPADFKEVYNKSFDYPIEKFLSTHYALYQFLSNDSNPMISMAHGSGVIGNGYYELKGVTASQLAAMVLHPQNPYVMKVLGEWLEESKSIFQNNDYYLKNMLYWEQRCGNWAVQSTTQADTYRDTFYPFNNRKLLIAQLGYSFQQKDFFYLSYLKLTRALIKEMWADLLKLPINPQKKWKDKSKSYLNRLKLFHQVKLYKFKKKYS